MAKPQNRGIGNISLIDVERCSARSRDKPGGSKARSVAASSGPGIYPREAPTGGQSVLSRKPSGNGQASCRSPVTSGERGEIVCCACCSKGSSTPTTSVEQNTVSARPSPDQGHQVRWWCVTGKRRKFCLAQSNRHSPPPPDFFALERRIQSDRPACFLFFVRPWHQNLVFR